MENGTKGTTITCSVKDVTSAGGIRLEMNDRGETKGRYDAACIETVLVQIKPDGTCEWETKGFDLTKDGGVIGFVGKGSGSQFICSKYPSGHRFIDRRDPLHDYGKGSSLATDYQVLGRDVDRHCIRRISQKSLREEMMGLGIGSLV